MSLYDRYDTAIRTVLADADSLIAALEAAKVAAAADLAAAVAETRRVTDALSEARAEIDHLQDEVGGLQQENADLLVALGDVQGQRAALEAQVAALEAEVAVLRARIAELEGAQGPGTMTVGALRPGEASYQVPTSGPVVFVSPSGNDSNAGTISAPKRTVVAASNAIKSQGTAATPATVVLREGTYHEGGYQPGDGHYLRWQAYPGEVAWLDGSVVVTSWTASGNTWWTPYAAPAVPAIGNDKIGGDPNALLPDLCFINGAELYQVADGATPTAGQFSVDRNANRLYIGTDPAGKEVRVSDLTYVTHSGSRIDILGIGARRYRCAGSPSLHTAFYFGGTSTDVTIENCHFEQMGRNCFFVGKDRPRFTANTFRRIGQTAILGGDHDDLIIERNYITQTDTGKWRPQPTSGAIKITDTQGVVIRDNYLSDSWQGCQIWLDVSCTMVDIVGNYVDGATVDGSTFSDVGINYEECDGGYWSGVQRMSRIVGNTVLNCRKSVVVNASGYVIVANNTISSKWTSRSEQAILVLQDRDVSHGLGGKVPLINCPWWTTGVEIINNRILPQAGGWQLLAYDSQGEVPRARAIAGGYGDATGRQIGGAMLSKVAGNWFAPATGSSSSGSIMATIGRVDGSRKNVNTPAQLAAADAAVGINGQVGANHQSAADPTTPEDHATGEPLSADIAALLGVPTGTRAVGPVTPALTVRS